VEPLLAELVAAYIALAEAPAERGQVPGRPRRRS
jgi:hypothetical protein